MQLKQLITAAVLMWGGIGAAHASQLSLAEATGFNVFVFSNLTGTSDAQGAVAVGGNFNPGSGGFTVGAQSAASPNGFSLVVGGNFTETYNSVGAGNIYVGGNMNWNDPSANGDIGVVGNFTNSMTGGSVSSGTIFYGGSYSSGDSLPHANTSASLIQANAPLNFSSALTDMKSLSTTLEGYTANGMVVDSYNNYTLTGTNANLNVFDLTASSYSGGSITINAPAGSTVIINVSGTSDSFTNGQIQLSGVSMDDVIWNFNSAATLTMSGYGFDGTVLAPLANYTGTWGQIDGQFIGNSIAGTTQFNEDLFSGNLGTTSSLGPDGGAPGGATPEPSTWFLMATAVATLLLVQVNRRRAAVVAVSNKQ